MERQTDPHLDGEHQYKADDMKEASCDKHQPPNYSHLHHKIPSHRGHIHQSSAHRSRRVASFGLIVLRRNFDGKAPDGFINHTPLPVALANRRNSWNVIYEQGRSNYRFMGSAPHEAIPLARRRSHDQQNSPRNCEPMHGVITAPATLTENTLFAKPHGASFVKPEVGSAERNPTELCTQARASPLILPMRPCASTRPYSVLIVQKKNSHSFCDIISGRIPQSVGDGTLRRVVDELAVSEKRLLLSVTYKEMWNLVAASHKQDRWELGDFRNGERRFAALRQRLFTFVGQSITAYPYSELGFPKGRIERAESKLRCAIREFEEETGYLETDIVIPDPSKYITEAFEGADGRLYVHTYFVAILKDCFQAPSIKERNEEIQNIGWVPLELLESSTSGFFRDYERTKFGVLRDLRAYIQCPQSWVVDL